MGMIDPRIAKALVVARSGLQRYPRQIAESIVSATTAVPRVSPQINFDHFQTGRIAAAWVGHATVLFRIGGYTILTDPVFSNRIGMRLGGVTVGIKRLLPPAVDVEHLPKIDIVLLSHAHFDHLDKPSLRRLAQGPARGATVVTADRTRTLIPDGFGEVVQLGWGREIRLANAGRGGVGAGDGLRIEALQPRHWGARAGVDRYRRYNAYVLEHGRDRVLFAGDTAFTDAFDGLRPVDLSVFGIGAYEGWDGAHATPEQVWKMFTKSSGGESAGGLLLPMHHSTFDMGEKHVDEPMQRLLIAAGEQSGRIICREQGDVWTDRARPGAAN